MPVVWGMASVFGGSLTDQRIMDERTTKMFDSGLQAPVKQRQLFLNQAPAFALVS